MLVCGIDIGTTNIKVSLVDGAGRAQWTRAIPTPRLSVSQHSAADPAVVVASIETLIIEGWRQVGSGKPLLAVTTTGVGEDGICVGDELEPLSVAIPWYDRSSLPHAALIRASRAATSRTGIEMDYTRTGARWLWLRQYQPKLFERASQWIALTDYPSAVWSGRPFISETLAARTGCYDVTRRTWIAELLAVCGAPSLPPIARAGAVVGRVVADSLLKSGVASPDTMVVAGGHDHPVAASLVQRIDPLGVVDSIGTANVVYAETPSPAPDELDPLIAFTVPIRRETGTACLGVFEFSSAVRALEARGIDMQAFLDLPQIPGKPELQAEEAPFAKVTGPREVLEMATIAAQRMMDRMQTFGAANGKIYATGGWSRSRALIELRASIYGQPVCVLSEREPAVVGAALLAAEGAGFTIDPTESVSIRTIEPEPIWAQSYRQRYDHQTPQEIGHKYDCADS